MCIRGSWDAASVMMQDTWCGHRGHSRKDLAIQMETVIGDIEVEMLILLG